MSTSAKYAAECESEYQRYREKCRATSRGDGVHSLWVKLAWKNRCNQRAWLKEVA